MPRSALLFAAFSLAATAALARAEEREVPEFDSLQVASGIRATVEIGPRRSLRVEADDDILPLVDVHVEDGALRVGFKPNTNFRGDRRVSVSIQTARLRAVSASGGSVVRATLTRAEETAAQGSGGSELYLRGVDANHLSVQGSGGSTFEIEGRASTLDLHISGGSRLLGRDLSVRDVVVQASGGSQGELRADGQIRGSLSGGSELHVRGGARAMVAATGGSSVDVQD
jgi:hypothetical protein